MKIQFRGDAFGQKSELKASRDAFGLADLRVTAVISSAVASSEFVPKQLWVWCQHQHRAGGYKEPYVQVPQRYA